MLVTIYHNIQFHREILLEKRLWNRMETVRSQAHSTMGNNDAGSSPGDFSVGVELLGL